MKNAPVDPDSTINDDHIKILIENNPNYTTQNLAEILKISKFTIHEHYVWLLHDLGEIILVIVSQFCCINSMKCTTF